MSPDPAGNLLERGGRPAPHHAQSPRLLIRSTSKVRGKDRKSPGGWEVQVKDTAIVSVLFFFLYHLIEKCLGITKAV